MRLAAVLTLIVIIAVCVAPLAYAQEESRGNKPDTILQRLADKINEPISMEIKPRKTVEEFQDMADGIRIGSQEAKQMSLRNK